MEDLDESVHRLSKYAIANSLKIFWDRQVMKFIWKKNTHHKMHLSFLVKGGLIL